jgi:hypothetical protein
MLHTIMLYLVKNLCHKECKRMHEIIQKNYQDIFEALIIQFRFAIHEVYFRFQPLQLLSVYFQQLLFATRTLLCLPFDDTEKESQPVPIVNSFKSILPLTNITKIFVARPVRVDLVIHTAQEG